MSTFIDRRLNPKDKTLKNRQRFIRVHKKQIQEAVKKALTEGDIKTSSTGVVVKPTDEPTFSIDRNSGDIKKIYADNDRYVVGDKVEKPQKGGGESGTQAGDGPDSEDDFSFVLTEDEFLDFVFEELELPDLVKKQIKNTEQVTYKRAGYKQSGSPVQLDLVKTIKNSIGRRIGLKRPKDEEVERLESLIAMTDYQLTHDVNMSKEDQQNLVYYLEELEAELELAKQRRIAVPWLDPFDVRYRNYQAVPSPSTQAVMFCVMDISASMAEKQKELAKRFYMLLYLFLKRKYTKIDVVFISHTSSAYEVDEQEFFYSQRTGGTLVSPALKMVNDIIAERYDLSQWNIYVANCSDGDNTYCDSDDVTHQMQIMLPKIQYFAYIEVKDAAYAEYAPPYTVLWASYQQLKEINKKIQMKKVYDQTDVWKVFKQLFKKEGAEV